MSTYCFLHRVNPKIYTNLRPFIAKENRISQFNGFHLVSSPNLSYLKVGLGSMKFSPRPASSSFMSRHKTVPQYFSIQLFKVSSNAGGRKCWNCATGLENSSVFCKNCGSLQPINTKNNCFEIFSVKQEYDLDLAYVKKKYRELQTGLHPDKFSSKSKVSSIFPLVLRNPLDNC